MINVNVSNEERFKRMILRLMLSVALVITSFLPAAINNITDLAQIQGRKELHQVREENFRFHYIVGEPIPSNRTCLILCGVFSQAYDGNVEKILAGKTVEQEEQEQKEGKK